MLNKILMILLVATYSFAQSKEEISWETKFEKSNYFSTSNYNETIEYFNKIADNSEFAELKTIGISPQGRELKCLIVSRNKNFTPQETKENNNAVILINNGIHSGEIEGKDASMLLLREMLIEKTKEKIFDNVTLLIVPVFNVDGHERSSPYNRINQNGPTNMGWRTTAQNFNLNRDFAKAETPEMKALLKLYSEWLPDIFIDTHTTDGADYQYIITYGITNHQDVPPSTHEFVNTKLIPRFEKDVNDTGYLIMPYVGFIKGDYKNGIRDWVSTPRYSHSYAGAQNRIGVLIETHMIKPYKDRVYSTKAMLESIIRFGSENYKELNKISQDADKFMIDKFYTNHKPYPINYNITDDSTMFNYMGLEYDLYNSKISGSKIKKFTNRKNEINVPYFNKVKIVDSVSLPEAYLIPNEWKSLVSILELHGVKTQQLDKAKKYIVEKYKFSNVKFASFPYESHFIPQFDYSVIKDTLLVNNGDYIVFTNQRSLGMIAYLLEPKSRESFVKWGMMNIIFERKEYFENYSMEPIAQRMYDESKILRDEFNKELIDNKEFANNPRERLNFFYKKSPYYDQNHNIYPILRIVN